MEDRVFFTTPRWQFVQPTQMFAGAKELIEKDFTNRDFIQQEFSHYSPVSETILILLALPPTT